MPAIHREHEGNVRAILSLLDSIPAELLVLSPQQNVRLIQATGEMRTALNRWNSGNYALQRVIGLDRHPYAVIYEALSECDDEPRLAAEDARLDFLADEELRRTISGDLAAIERAWSNQEFKAVTVLAGSVAEALLLDAIRASDREVIAASHVRLREAGTLPPDSSADYLRWTLAELNGVALEVRLIEERTWTQVNLAREFRNFIHPGRELRTQARCSRKTALTALAAIESVIEDLSTRRRVEG